ncbi:MAG: hypothetical protein ACP5JU_02385 [Minisyncoccia bacterium]
MAVKIGIDLGTANRRRKDFEEKFYNIEKCKKIKEFLVYKDSNLFIDESLRDKKFLSPVNRKFFQSSYYKQILNNHYFKSNF